MQPSECAPGAKGAVAPWIFCLLNLVLLSSCAVTSPYWGYVPASITTPIPFQAWGINTNPLYVECANDTSAHGYPTAGEASYIAVTTLTPSAAASLDSASNAIFSASKKVVLPSVCWKYFGSYGFWQANVRAVRMEDGRKVPLSTYDLRGLECLGRENGKVARWYGFNGKGCEMTYLGETTAIPYIVLRIFGYREGLEPRAAGLPPEVGTPPPPPRRGPSNVPAPNTLPSGAARPADVSMITPEAVEAAKRGGLR